MRILLVGRFYDEGVSSFISAHLTGLGHTVMHYDPGPKFVAHGNRAAFYWNRLASTTHSAISTVKRSLSRSQTNSALNRALSSVGQIDLVLSTHDLLTPADAKLIKEVTKAPLALWYPDPIWSFQRHMFLNASYDALFFKDPFLVDILRRKLKAPVFYLPECYSQNSLSPTGLVEERFKCEICTAGNLYAYRVAFFRQLTEFDLKIWGLPAPLWMDVGPLKPSIKNRFVAHSEKAAAFRGAKIVLNNLNPAEMWGTNVRTFEIAGAGGFQMVDWRPGLSQLFEIGRELVAFDDIDDLRSKLIYFLNAPEERAAIAAAGHVRALRDHTYDHRLLLLLDTMKGRAQGYPLPRVSYAIEN